jgi:uncharacterized repeat protein (TIGR01451 family)
MGFTDNFIWYAPETAITFSPTENNTLQWYSCREPGGADYPDTGNGPTACPFAPSGPLNGDTIEGFDLNDNPVPQQLDTWTWQGSSIFLVCGNPIYPLPQSPATPVPTIVGSKFNDLNQNGVQDPGEPGIPNWPMTLTRVSSEYGQPTGFVATTTTDSNGNFNFALDGDGPGVYAVTEGSEPGWYNDTGGTTEYVTVNDGIGNATLSVPPFGNRHEINIVGSKFNDLNRNGVRDPGEPGIPDWPMTLTRLTSDYNDQPTGVVVATTTTDSNGNFDFTLNGDAGPGIYAVTEGSEPGWYNDTGGTTEDVTVDDGIGNATLSVPPFGNWHEINIVGSKFNDLNKNGIWDPGEPGIPNWPVTLTRVTSDYNDQPTGVVVATTTTDRNGNFDFTLEGNAGPGLYAVTEGSVPGWYNDTGGTTQYVTVSSGIGSATLSVPPFGNWQDFTGSQVHAVIQVETSPAYAGDPVQISSDQLTTSCAGEVVFETLEGGSTSSPTAAINSITVTLDDEGNATVTVDASECAPGSDLVEADLTQAPYLSASVTLDVDPPQPTSTGITASPTTEVETGDDPTGSDVYTVFYVETDPVYAGQRVEITSPDLQDRCGGGWRWEAAGGPAITQASPPSPVEATLDGDGNAVFVFKGASCAPGSSAVTAEVLAGSHPTYATTFTVNPPAVKLAGLMSSTVKHHRRHHHGSGSGTPAMVVTASPNPLIETSSAPVLDTVNVVKSDNYGGSSNPPSTGQINDYNGALTYTITVSNTGPATIDGVVSDQLSSDPDFTSDTYTATTTGGATGFTSPGSGDINDTVVLPAGSSITYTVPFNFTPCGSSTSLSNTVTFTPSGGVALSPGSNTTATDDDNGPPC